MKWHSDVKRLCICLLLVAALCLPTMGQATQTAGAIRFDTPRECERMRIDSVEFTRADEGLRMVILYTLNDPLTQRDEEALELMFFNIMADAGDTEFPTTGGAGSSIAVSPDVGWRVIAGEQYREETQWDAIEAFPDVIYIRPYYKLIGEWGEAVALSLSEATVVG